jgi:predicted ATP-grasp superfamily ATP-dependent carboligase
MLSNATVIELVAALKDIAHVVYHGQGFLPPPWKEDANRAYNRAYAAIDKVKVKDLSPSQEELLDSLEAMLNEMVSLFDLLNRQDPALMAKIERHELETDNNAACQHARELLKRERGYVYTPR